MTLGLICARRRPARHKDIPAVSLILAMPAKYLRLVLAKAIHTPHRHQRRRTRAVSAE
jgi:hypothetical protein